MNPTKDKKNQVKQNDKLQGYWMYKNGYSYWGICIMKGCNELPVKINADLHAKNIDEKIQWYQENTKVTETA